MCIISIVTVTLNRLSDLKKTFNSTLAQTYSDIEYIVIDGGSTDGTVEFLEDNHTKFSYWISEPDAGIYDAMNKAARVAQGEWIIFMNAGDRFFSEGTLAQVIPYLKDSADVVYGGVESIVNDRYGKRAYQRSPHDLSLIWREIPTCHQSIFVRRELQVKYLFDSSLTWCADHDFLAKLYANSYIFREIPIIVSTFDASGGASRDLVSFTRERWSICKRYFGKSFQYNWYFINEYNGFWIQKNVIRPIRELLPSEWVVSLRKYRGIY
jgi:glycosyltransferase involved in cell wall biosynthesis